MSVYTVVSQAAIEQFIQGFNIGSVRSYRGINEGIENSNYFVDTECGRYVLTLFEWLEENKLPYFIKLMCHTADAGLPCPRPIADRRGQTVQRLATKPATLITRLAGHTIKEPSVVQCRQVGDILAKMHLTMRSFDDHSENMRGLDWFKMKFRAIQAHLNRDERALLSDEIQYQNEHVLEALPTGTIHADLFRDNVLFDGARLSGVIDFYYACYSDLLYDVAVVVNDWCRSAHHWRLSQPHYNALIQSYHSQRPFAAIERSEWQNTLRRAALRFWLSRLYDKLFPKTGLITHIKDPDVFRNILLLCREDHHELY